VGARRGRNRGGWAPGTADGADQMHVLVGRVRHIEIIGVTDDQDIEPARRDDRGHQERHLALAELFKRRHTRGRDHVAVQRVAQAVARVVLGFDREAATPREDRCQQHRDPEQAGRGAGEGAAVGNGDIIVAAAARPDAQVADPFGGGIGAHRTGIGLGDVEGRLVGVLDRVGQIRVGGHGGRHSQGDPGESEQALFHLEILLALSLRSRPPSRAR